MAEAPDWPLRLPHETRARFRAATSIVRRVAGKLYSASAAGPISCIEMQLEYILVALRAAGDSVGRMTFAERGTA
jgi:hypothetical protein